MRIKPIYRGIEAEAVREVCITPIAGAARARPLDAPSPPDSPVTVEMQVPLKHVPTMTCPACSHASLAISQTYSGGTCYICGHCRMAYTVDYALHTTVTVKTPPVDDVSRMMRAMGFPGDTKRDTPETIEKMKNLALIQAVGHITGAGAFSYAVDIGQTPMLGADQKYVARLTLYRGIRDRDGTIIEAGHGPDRLTAVTALAYRLYTMRTQDEEES